MKHKKLKIEGYLIDFSPDVHLSRTDHVEYVACFLPVPRLLAAPVFLIVMFDRLKSKNFKLVKIDISK